MAFLTRILKCNPSSIKFTHESDYPQISDKETLEAIESASHHLVDRLEPVVFPTETVYGLGAVASNTTAVSRIYSVKGRPPDNPLIVHVSSLAMLQTLIPRDFVIPRTYRILMKCFWPGALTLLFPRDISLVPSIITANQPTVAIRMPSHPTARALIAISNTPLAAPSANSSGKPSPTKAEHVERDLSGKVSLILDSGPCDVGLESTVLDGLHADGNIRVLRPGGVTVEDIKEALRKHLPASVPTPQILVHTRDYRDEAIEAAPTTPGMKYRHYSPSVPVTLLLTNSQPPPGVETASALSYFTSLKEQRVNCRPLIVGILAPSDSVIRRIHLPSDGLEWHWYSLGSVKSPSSMAHNLFDGLFTLERQGVDLILIEEVPEEQEGLAVMNRVRKAASDIKWITFP